MISDYFNTTFAVYQMSASVDENNFEKETEVLKLSNKGFFEPLSGFERFINDKTEVRSTHRLFCPVLNIIEKDSITIDSVNYNIDLINNFQNNHLEVYLIRRQ